MDRQAGGEVRERALSEVLDRLEADIEGASVSVGELADKLGRRSFPALMLVPALIAVSPASGIPGFTSTVGLVVASTAAQMLWGRDCVWLPGFLARRRIPAHRLVRAIAWLRRPVDWIEPALRPRLGVLVRRPGVALPLVMTVAIGVAMPVLEFIPTSGSLAAAAVALFSAGLLARDGVLVLLGLAYLVGMPLLVWHLVT